MHRAVYEARPDIHAVLHASPFTVRCSPVRRPKSRRICS
ncbi:class II aldolase/adducin family protein [Paenibacillus sp. CC-CFT747]|nr:class II aldolase/adducin family protein [Paenibacillus sp. CC-CFT747]